MAAQQAPNVDLFDLYFRRADLDQDGRISGAEAVSFFQGSGLPKNILARIWEYADPNRSGFLGRAEFYNYLKLVTVAQSKRELTPDIVKAALGPASAKIPAPKINLVPGPQLSSATASPAPQMGAVTPPSSQNLGFRPQVPPSTNMNQQYNSSRENQFMRPPQLSGSAPHLAQGVSYQGVPGGGIPQGFVNRGLPGGGPAAGPHVPNSIMSSERTSGTPVGTALQVSGRGISPSTAQGGFGQPASGFTASRPPRPQTTSVMMPPKPPVKDSKAPGVFGNGFASDSTFGSDLFSANPSQTKQGSSAPTFSVGNIPVSSATVPVSAGIQQSSFAMQPVGGQLQQTQPLTKQNQQVSARGASAFTSSGIPLGAEHSASTQSQLTWPRITQSDVHRYNKIFVAVDADKDGKITGEEARRLFLNWHLPREVLKQVWDLSDQDNDSMLSLREFCIALYLMERHREGRPLPAVLPSSIIGDFPTTSQPSVGYSNAAYGPTSGLQQKQGMPGPSAQQVMSATGVMPPMPVAAPQANAETHTKQQKSKVPVLEKNLVNQLDKEEQNSLNSKFQEATEAEKKVEELEKEILDSQEKIEFYRTKMQELILYKSRCDNRVNEIIERASADKREVETLVKKYEEKYKQVGDVASKLTAEEATFRDIQERKMELYQAIVKMEQDGSADGVLQDRADRIQSDFDELFKSLNDRCKKYGLRVKPTALVELPFGWQPGIQEGAADWDEVWDKFEDEGFTLVKELTLEIQNVIAPPRPKWTPVKKENASTIESPKHTSTIADDDNKSEKASSTGEHVLENGSAREAESVRSPPESPARQSPPSREFSDFHFDKVSSPLARENQSEQGGGPESLLSADRGFDEPSWGTFDTTDDADSVWGFNPASTSQELDLDSHKGENYFFGSGDLGLNPIRTTTGSSLPAGSSTFHTSNVFADSVPSTPFQSSNVFADSVPSTPFQSSNVFADSVPSTPSLFASGYSPPRFNEYSFDTSSMHGDNFFSRPSREMARFDSMRSTTTEDNTFSRFDSSFDHGGRENATFSRFDSMRSTTNDFDHGRSSNVFARFDSMKSTTSEFDHGHGHGQGFPSFDDPDPFGSSGPFRTSLESQTPKRGSDNWNAF